MNLSNGIVDNYFSVLKDDFVKNGETNWSENQENMRNKVVNVYNKDFEHGTLRVRVPCILVLKENVYFNPNRPESWLDKDNQITDDFNEAVALNPNRVLDYMPTMSKEENKQYFQEEVRFGYSLGFFAALAIECDNVIVDLNGYVFQQHLEHSLQQRFFAIIELADQPFIPNQGPGNFGRELRSSNHCMICNGTLGLSSHHSVHGNSAKNIYFKNLDFVNFEVAALSLHGCKEITMYNLNIMGNLKDVKVLGTYSAARFIKVFYKMLEPRINISERSENVYKIFEKEMDSVFNSVIFNNVEMPHLYENVDGLIDGNPYGILINPLGVAVGELLRTRNNASSNQTSTFNITNVSINKIKGKINEILGLQDSNNKMLTDVSGSIFQFFGSIARREGTRYYYEGTTLADMQIELAKIGLENPNIANHLGKLNIPESIIYWKEHPESYFELTVGTLVGQNGITDGFKIIANGDSMFHVNKGVFGLRIDGLNRGVINNLDIFDIDNCGIEGSIKAGPYLYSHPGQKWMQGYHGHNTYGLTMCGCNNIEIDNLCINKIGSVHGSSIGMMLCNESSNVEIKKMQVKNVSCSQKKYVHDMVNWPNPHPVARGLKIFNDVEFISINGLIVESIKNCPSSLENHNNEILSLINIKTTNN